MNATEQPEQIEGIAIVGMAGRFPGARNLEEFWRNLKNGVESISFFTDDELLAEGMDPALVGNANYIKARGVLGDIEYFDAPFFGHSPRFAELMDPQHRAFLECAWSALENAGYDAGRYKGRIGVYGGQSMNTYMITNLLDQLDLVASVDGLQAAIGNDKDSLTTEVAYKLNLKGPGITIQSSSSTSLVAVHVACQSLLGYECDMALAGGVSIHCPEKAGYMYSEGGTTSRDGHCRAFDAKAQGFVSGHGVGVVVLKRLEDALADGDYIWAVIKGSAVNNDGSLKVSYMAPSVDGQAEVVALAQAIAGVNAESIGYIEAHGTATAMGDPIEITALTQAFRLATKKTGFCVIGSVKTNIGHLDSAAGVAGLIKTALVLRHKAIPPTLHFEKPNPRIDFRNSPFYVNTALIPWDSPGPRRAGVTSLGMGGTNAHVILEEAPDGGSAGESRPWQLFLLSAKTPTALETASANLAGHLREHPGLDPADVAYTLQIGRKMFQHRRMLLCRGLDEACAALSPCDPERVLTAEGEPKAKPIAFMFSGQGAQHVEMAAGLFHGEPVFRAQLDLCAELLRPHLDLDLREVLYPAEGGREEAARRLGQTSITQPALFAIEYALARLWMSWGIRPQAMIGHSIGEYVAACLAGVLPLEQALALVAARGRLMQDLPSGSMLAVPLSEEKVAPLLGQELSLAAVNSPSLCVVSGPTDAVAALEKKLAGTVCRPLLTSHAFHSAMMEPILERFTALLGKAELHPPAIPYVSNVTGRWITEAEAMDPAYWARHLRHAVRFADGVRLLLGEPDRVLLEVGPGITLTTLARQAPERSSTQVILSSLGHPREKQPDQATLLNTLGRLWLAGIEVDWPSFYANEERRRVPLPTYPFERRRYWVEPRQRSFLASSRANAVRKRAQVAEWLYRPRWEKRPLPASAKMEKTVSNNPWLIFADQSGLGAEMARRLMDRGLEVAVVRAGKGFVKIDAHSYEIDPGDEGDYRALLGDLGRSGRLPRNLVHLWGVTGQAPSGEVSFPDEQERGFYSLISLLRALAAEDITDPVQLGVVSDGLQEVTGQEVLHPHKATLLAPCKVAPQETPNLTCLSIDLEIFPKTDWRSAPLVDQFLADLGTPAADRIVAYRGGDRWVEVFEPVGTRDDGGRTRLRPGGVYLITGGLGRVGLDIAAYLAETVHARLVLVNRTGLPAREDWDAWLTAEGSSAEVRSRDKTGLPEVEKDRAAVAARIRRVRQLEDLGAEVLIAAADVSDPAGMERVIAETCRRFGALDGVVHAAGVIEPALIKDTERDACERQFLAKVQGTLVLDRVLQGRACGFRLLVSSLSTVLGGLGYAAYAAANLSLDAFARSRNRTAPGAWMSVDFEAWQAPAMRAGLGATLAEFAMTQQEVKQVLDRLFSMPAETRVVISSGDLQARLAIWSRPSVRSVAERPDTGAADQPRPKPAADAQTPAGDELTRTITEVWRSLLGVERVGLHDNFFDLGGNSLIGVQVIARLSKELNTQIPVTSLFEAPTVAALAKHLRGGTEDYRAGTDVSPVSADPRRRESVPGGALAIVGMAGRFPGARDVDEFWRNLSQGKEGIQILGDEELAALGVDRALLGDPYYVKARSLLEGYEDFDAAFFGYSHREAEMTDPQQRVFLECTADCLENAGYDPETYAGSIGVYAGAGINTYLLYNIGSHPEIFRMLDPMQISIANNIDLLTTRASYKLNLRGPSQAIQSACSTSLVAVHYACRGLLNNECDLALAGGVCINVAQRTGYRYIKEAMASPDGHCRAFDARAGGTVFGGGVGLVALKRLEDAIADGDCIRAVIRGSSVNNDGSLKVGFTAPSVEGQSAVIAEALKKAGVAPRDITYVETHGTGTHLGDPIEIQALTKAFRTDTAEKGFCAIGSVKTNIGHLEAAAGVAGLCKTVLAIENGQIPPSLHFEEPNPEIDFANSPFYVNTALSPWKTEGAPRRAGVSSFGIGGTNAHVIVEEAPPAEAVGEARPHQLLILSAKTAASLERATHNLAVHLKEHPPLAVADVAYTLQIGRKAYPHRRMLVCQGLAEAAEALASLDPERLLMACDERDDRSIVYMFPGEGSQYDGMGAGLYQDEPVFREHVDQCAELLLPHLGFDLRQVLYPSGEQTGQDLDRPSLGHPALFVVEYALAKLWRHWGIEPAAMIGHGLGEYVAACLSGALSLEDALGLVAARGRLLEDLPAGAALEVALPARDVQTLLGKELSLAAVNAPSLCVLSGPVPKIEALAKKLTARGVGCRRLATSHALHSAMIEPAMAAFAQCVQRAGLRPPEIPYLSGVTGSWISAEQAADPGYWVEHLRQTIRFADGIGRLAADPGRVFLEVGPNQSLCAMVGEQSPGHLILGSLCQDPSHDAAFILNMLGRLWLAGLRVDWRALHGQERRRRVPLPTYSFDRQRYWIEQRGLADQGTAGNMEPNVAARTLAPPVSPPASTLRPRPQLQTAYVAPGTDVEKIVARIIQELLGLAELGLHDNLLELGLSSLLATQVAVRLRDALQVDLPLRTFFERQTLAQVAAAVEEIIIQEIEGMSEEEAKKLVEESDE